MQPNTDKPCQERLELAWKRGYIDYRAVGSFQLTQDHFDRFMSEPDYHNPYVHHEYWNGWLAARAAV